MASGNPPGRPRGIPKTGGRQKGTPNRTTVETRTVMARLMDADFEKALAERLKAWTLDTPILLFLLKHRYGDPPQSVSLDTPPDGALAKLVAFYMPENQRRSK